MATVKLYGTVMSSYTARAAATLEELGVEYEIVPMDPSTGEAKQPQHLARNPFGKTPAFQDGGLILFESRAISRYIARKYRGTGTDLLGSSNPEEAALVDVWMEVESQDFNPPIATIIYQLFAVPSMGGVPDEALLAESAEKLGKVLDVYEDKLSKTKYLAGDFFSLADLHHLTFTHYLVKLTPYAFLVNSCPKVKAWWEDMSSRPACSHLLHDFCCHGCNVCALKAFCARVGSCRRTVKIYSSCSNILSIYFSRSSQEAARYRTDTVVRRL